MVSASRTILNCRAATLQLHSSLFTLHTPLFSDIRCCGGGAYEICGDRRGCAFGVAGGAAGPEPETIMKTCQAKWGQVPGGWEVRGRQLG